MPGSKEKPPSGHEGLLADVPYGELTMTESSSNPYSAGEQGLGYIYQGRFALLKLLQLPENNSILIEKDDDLDFVDQDGIKTLASLKHKAGVADKGLVHDLCPLVI